jgi:serine/threonine-protein kinase PknK
LRTLTTEAEEETTIRLLLAEQTPAAAGQACIRAERLVGTIATADRPRALTSAELLRAACLYEAGRPDGAVTIAVPALLRCAEHGLVRFAADEGPPLRRILAALDANPDRAPDLSRTFLRKALAEPVFESGDSTDVPPSPQ